MGSQRLKNKFNSAWFFPSSPFERYRRFTSPSKRAADSQNVGPPSNTDAPVYVHRWATSAALRWRSSEREKKLSNELVASHGDLGLPV